MRVFVYLRHYDSRQDENDESGKRSEELRNGENYQNTAKWSFWIQFPIGRNGFNPLHPFPIVKCWEQTRVVNTAWLWPEVCIFIEIHHTWQKLIELLPSIQVAACTHRPGQGKEKEMSVNQLGSYFCCRTVLHITLHGTQILLWGQMFFCTQDTFCIACPRANRSQ